MTLSTSSPSRAKSADRMLGAMRKLLVMASTLSSVPRAGRLLGRVAADRVVDVAARSLGAHQLEAALVGWPVDDEGHADRLEAPVAVERQHLDVLVRVGLAAGLDFHHHAGGIGDVEHRLSPHIPIGVAGMRVVGRLDRDRPALIERVSYLLRDFLVRQVGEEGELTLCQAHGHGTNPRIRTRAWGSARNRRCRSMRSRTSRLSRYPAPRAVAGTTWPP